MAGEQEEQSSARDGAGVSDDQAAAGDGAVHPRPVAATAGDADDGLTGTRVGAAPVPEWPVRVDDPPAPRPTGVGFRRAVRTVLNLLAVILRFIGLLLAAILVARVALAFVPVNPGNVIVEWITRFADVLVWGFRDLFLPTDPRIGLVANYGLAAFFWLAVGLIAAGALSALGRRVAGRSRS